MFQKLFRKNTESVGDANSQKDYFYLICALFHRGLPDMAKSQIQTAKNYLTEDEYSDLVKYLAQRPDVPAGFQLQ